MNDQQKTKEELIKELELNRTALKLTQEIAQIGSWEFDLQTKDLHWSSENYKIFNIDEDTPPEHLYELYRSTFKDPAEWEKLDELVNHLIQTGEGYTSERSIITPKGTQKYIKGIAKALKDDKGNVIGMQGTAQDITQQREQENRRIQQKSALIELASIHDAGFIETLNKITELSAKTLNLARVSIWGLSVDKAEIYCKSLFKLKEGIHEEGLILTAKDHPNYFKALRNGIAIAADDAHTDPRTKEFTEDYLAPNGINSLLDVFIKEQGGKKDIGLVSFEHVGSTKKWTEEEQQFALSIANIASIAFERNERKQAEDALQKSQMLLKSSVESFKDIIVLSIDSNYNYLYFNKAHFESMQHGYKKEVEIGMNLLDYVTIEEDKQKAKDNYDRALAGESHSNIEVYGDAESSYFECFFSPIRNEKNEIIGATAVARDISDHLHAEEALRVSEARYRTLFENMNTGFVLFEVVENKQGIPIDLIILAANEEFEKTTGLNLKDAVGMHLTKVLPGIEKDEADWIGTYSKVALTGESIQFEQGSELLRYYYSISAFKAAPNQCAVTFVDITDRKQAEDQLRLQSTMLNAVGQAVIATDIKGIITYFNKAAEELYGWPVPEVIGQNILEVTVPETSNAQAQEIMEALTLNKSWSGEFMVQNRAGKTFPASVHNTSIIEDTGKLIGIIGISMDITERKQAEMELIKSKEETEESEKLYRKTFDYAPSGIAHVSPDGNIMKANRMFCTITGYSYDELLKLKFSDITHPDDLLLEMKDVERVLSNEIDNINIEKRYIHKKGHVVWVSLRSSIVRENDNILYAIASISDITENKILQEELIKAKDKAEESETKLKEAQSMAKLGHWELNLVTSKLHWCDSVFEIFEIDKEQFEATYEDFLNVVHPDDRQLVNDAYTRSVETKQPYDIEHRLQLADGRIKWLKERCKTDYDEKGKALRSIGIVQDITEQKQAELELQKTKDLLTITNRIARIGGWELDLIKNQLTWTDITREIHEVDSSYVPNVAEAINFYKEGASRDNILDSVNRTIETGEGFNVEHQLITAKGNELWVRSGCQAEFAGDKVVRLYGTFQDITERKQSELALQESEKKFRELFENLIDEVHLWKIVKDKTEKITGWQLVDANPSALKAWGKSINDVIGKTAIEIFGADAYGQFMPIVEEIFKTYKPYHWENYFASTGQYLQMESIPFGDYVISTGKDITAIKKENQQLKLLESVITNTKDSVLIAEAEPFDEPGPKIIYVNEAFTKMTGYTAEEVIGKTPRILQGPNSDKEALARLSKAMRKWEPCEITTINYKKSGEEFWINFAVTPVADETGWYTHWIAIERDITEQKKSEQALKDSELRLSLAAQAGGVGVWDLDIVANKLTWDDQMFALYGIKREEFSNAYEAWIKGVYEADRERGNTEIELAIKGEKEFNTEFRVQTPNGEIRNIRALATVVRDKDGNALRMIGTNWDVTEEKEALRQIEEARKQAEASEGRLVIAQGVAKVGSWETDLQTLEVVWSEETYKIFGTDHLSFQASHPAFLEFVHPDDKEKVDKAFFESFTKADINTVEHRIITVDNIVKHVEERWQIHSDLNGKPTRAVGTCQDITERKLAENELRLAKEQAEAASKAKSEFLANMSHEIRTPLNGVIGFTELLTKTPLSPVQQQYADSANVSGHTLLGIINDILDFSKIEAGMLELEEMKTDMLVLLENSIDIVKFSATDKEFELLLDIDPSMPRFAHLDAIRTKQILANLLSNAVKFTQKGEVALKVVYHALEGNQGKLSISVRDTGIGITEEQKAKLFKSFSQADSSTTRKFGGTGLGLIISQMIAEKMGSKINIDSTPGVGSTFSFDIITQFEEGEKLDTTQIIGVKRCLIIDDNDNNRLILEQMLKQWQIESDSCNSGLEIIKKLENSQPYDVIICDYDMPYLNGIDTIRLMKDQLQLSTEKQPVILLHSSLDNTELNQKCKELGIRFRLNKPIKSHDLFNYLSHLNQTTEIIPQKETEQPIKLNHTSPKIKILIAEDNPLNMLLSKIMLSQLMPNSEVYEAKNGLEAIEQYQSISPDLIFMDVHMPELDGLEATKKIRALEVNTNNHLPIVALTAGALKEEKEKCLAAGMDEFLTKPLESKKIQSVFTKFFPKGKKLDTHLQKASNTDEVHFGFKELLSNLSGDTKAMQQLISATLDEIPIRIRMMEESFKKIDMLTINSIAHLIRGMSLSMFCNVLADIAGKIEDNAKENTFQYIDMLLIELKEEWETVRNLLLQKINQLEE